MENSAFSLKGKRALITGGTSGIGLATAKRFVLNGASVVITGRRNEGFDIADKIDAKFVQADLADVKQIEQLIKESADILEGIDILISNAGELVEFTMLEDTTEDILKRMFDINSLSHYRLIRSAVRYLNDQASIIINSTLLTSLGNIGETAYGAAKSSLVTMTKGLAMEFAPRGIRVNLISPGATKGEMWEENHPQLELVKTLTALGRLCEQEEVAAMFHFLSADDCKFITGANIPVDGGITAGFAPQLLEKLMNS